MDLQRVREEANEATTRTFWDKNGFVPDEDSDEWEEEYRRQFEQAKRRHATGQPAARIKPAPAVTPPPEEEGWAVLTGAPTQILAQDPIVADRLATWMARHPEMEARLGRGGARRYLTTDDPRWFAARAAALLGRPIAAETVRLPVVAVD